MRSRDLARIRAELLHTAFQKQITADVEAGRISVEGVYSWHPPKWLEPAELTEPRAKPDPVR